MAGRKPGTPKTGGRKKGTPNKSTASLRDSAQQYTGEALKTLVEVMRNKSETGTARAAAANAVLDRGYGKPKQEIEANVNLFDQMDHDEQRALAAALQALARDQGEDAGGTTATHH